MTVYLQKPYNDELLYSVIARYCCHLSIKVYSFACDLFHKRFLKLRADLPSSLSTVSKSTYPIWGKSPEEILYEMTLFPFYEPFLPKKIKSNKMKALLEDTGLSTIGVKAYRVSSPTHLRYCNMCKKQDLEKHNETYWHRSHQLPGVLVCPEHVLPLSTSSALIQPTKTELADATIVTNGKELGVPPILSPYDHQMAHKIAKKCQDILFQEKSIWTEVDHNCNYRQAAIERGFFRLPGIFSHKMFEHEILKYYGNEFLHLLGISPSAAKTSWIQAIFYNNERQPVHPLEHILIQVFLEDMPIVASSHPYGPGPWKCPNPYANHNELFPIKSIRVRTTTRGSTIASAYCTCGFCFTFENIDPLDHHLPVNTRTARYGATWKAEVLRLKGNGLPISRIAETMNINESTVRKLLLFVPLDQVSNNVILKSRKAWTRLLKTCGNKVTIARRKNFGLYQFLRKHDREWIISQTNNDKKTIDWKNRDLYWSDLLKKSASLIKNSVPLRRAAKTVIVKEAGLNLRLFSEFDRLPLCYRFLQNHSESIEDFNTRVINHR